MSKPKKQAQFLYRTGHFWNPKNPDGFNIQAQDLGKLAEGDRILREAVASFQEADANFDHMTNIYHGRPVIADGDIGPATEAMFRLPRCSVPDHPAEAATGAGSWPVGCDPEYPDIHSVRVNIDTSKASAHQKRVLEQVLAKVEACEAEIGQRVRHIINGDPLKAEHDVKFQFIAGGVIGFAYFPKPNTCNQTVVCRIDSSYNQDVDMLAALFVHEYKGHSDGLQHTRGGIMNPSILRHSRLSWIGDPHEKTKRRYFGGEPLDPVEPPVEPPTPQPPVAANGIFTYTPSRDWPAGESRVLRISVKELE